MLGFYIVAKSWGTNAVVITRVLCKKMGYNMNVVQQTVCMVVNPNMVDNFASVFNCTMVSWVSDRMTASPAAV